jgi:hypothetical protein
VNATCVPKNASGSLKPPVLRLQKRIILRWSVVGYRWPTATNFHNGYRISPRPSAIELAKDGERNPDVLCEQALSYFLR